LIEFANKIPETLVNKDNEFKDLVKKCIEPLVDHYIKSNQEILKLSIPIIFYPNNFLLMVDNSLKPYKNYQNSNQFFQTPFFEVFTVSMSVFNKTLFYKIKSKKIISLSNKNYFT
jgi:hypothetical protein